MGDFTEDFGFPDGWDPSKSSLTTAWSNVESKKKNRRAYGRRGAGAPRRRTSKKRALKESAEETLESESLSFRSSFSSSSSYDGWNNNNENSNPNMMESSPLPPAKLKKVHDSITNSSSSSGSSFSYLAKSGEVGWGNYEEEVSPFTNNTRGICESPFLSSNDTSIVPVAPKNESKPEKKKTRKVQQQHYQDTDESDQEDDNDINISLESTEIFAASLPPKPVRRSSGAGFEQSVFFGSTSKKAISTNKVLDSLSCIQHLEYLADALRKEQQGTACFFQKTWTVAPRSTWCAEQRTAFMQFCKKLSFSVRIAGASLAFCQVNAEKGKEILDAVEGALLSHDPNKKPPKIEMSSEKISFAARVIAPPLDREVEVDLLQAVDSLSISNTSSKTPPLVRLVTLDSKPSFDDGTKAPSLPCFREEEEGDLSFDAPGRPSGELYVGGQDLMQHLHGWSPRATRLSRTRTLRDVSPMICPSTKKLPCNNNLADFVETPLIKRNNDSWVTKPSCRDWGVSTQCDKLIIDELTACFEEAHAASGFGTASSPLGDPSSSLCFVPVATAVVSSDLGFEYEVDASKQSHVIESTDEVLLELPKPGHFRRTSVGSTAFAGLNLEDEGEVSPEKARRKKMLSFAKLRRMSLCATALDPMRPIPKARQSLFATKPIHEAVASRSSLVSSDRTFFPRWSLEKTIHEPAVSPVSEALADPDILTNVFLFLREHEILTSASLVCSQWADAATEAHASLMLISVGCSGLFDEQEEFMEANCDSQHDVCTDSIAKSMERSWKFLTRTFPWANFLSEGAFKRVYRVYNSAVEAEEAVSVMDVNIIESLGNKDVVGAELAVSVMLSSLARRNICPNFVITRGVFTCPYEPPVSHWGGAEDKHPKGKQYVPGQALGRKPREPGQNNRGRYQYIRMELCREGDVEEYMKRLQNEMLELWEAQSMVFQIAFALHAAGDRYSMKHYDVKLLNIFLQDANAERSDTVDSSFTVLRYGIGSHVFALRMPTKQALIAKLADYGTANVQAESEGQPVNLAQFTTLENTPPEFLILGDAATQGYGHDCFGLGLCVLHLFTGHAPYEEILEDVRCPPTLKEKLERIWQDKRSSGYDVIRTVVLADVDVDEDGNIDGEPDQVLYDTFYRYLVLFGIPEKKFKVKEHGKVWRAISSSLENTDRSRGRPCRKNTARREAADAGRFARDQKKYSLSHGNNKYIARARGRLQKMDGAMELLLSLVEFDPQARATPLDVLNSNFMISLREESIPSYKDDIVHSFMAYSSSHGER